MKKLDTAHQFSKAHTAAHYSEQARLSWLDRNERIVSEAERVQAEQLVILDALEAALGYKLVPIEAGT